MGGGFGVGVSREDAKGLGIGEGRLGRMPEGQGDRALGDLYGWATWESERLSPAESGGSEFP
jgi:hypothetical protein